MRGWIPQSTLLLKPRRFDRLPDVCERAHGDAAASAFHDERLFRQLMREIDFLLLGERVAIARMLDGRRARNEKRQREKRAAVNLCALHGPPLVSLAAYSPGLEPRQHLQELQQPGRRSNLGLLLRQDVPVLGLRQALLQITRSRGGVRLVAA